MKFTDERFFGRDCRPWRRESPLILKISRRPPKEHDGFSACCDFNTAALPEIDGSQDAEPDWFANPQTYEPLFGLFKGAGFEWISANAFEQTRRILHDNRPCPKLNRLDWFFVRGLRASNPKKWSATGSENRPLSDNELITVDINVN